ncbi:MULTISPECIES: TetR/AcrR family transcriptional regulator [unclassified Crossiella]|uniref:TetR/AcrR family transcriptional regulator n=1 Tax=unclassified Crossiella TaxID=2620835 RepID=UPI001FFF8845|nr:MULTISPECIES: TetR/AcrR family transcriptional regulator [unclassified Crossiella]MCK2236490.1 TetR/AcrR family transcriptional regulator [Crossiella sp. S99.2]MCK2250157.1 TetR/AcrR family transcriptional regulator [Crossiella sp. S99.1]
MEGKARNRTALLEAAREVIVEEGHRGASLGVIAGRAGLTTGAIYSIFGSKRDLLIAVIEDIHRRVIADLQQLSDPRLSLEQVIAVYVAGRLRAADAKDAAPLLAFETELSGLAQSDPVVSTRLRDISVRSDRQFAESLTGRRDERGLVVDERRAGYLALGVRALVLGFEQRRLRGETVPESLVLDLATAMVRQ